MKNRYIYPFSAVIGQGLLKKALLMNVVNPNIGGVIISGEKGTAKSTLVRGLGNLIRNMEIVEIPLNVTEDMLVGAIDMEKAILDGKKAINNSILMEAHENILYVDEVNLLSESIINALLEVSQSGINHVEREGVSFIHECSFVLIGTMNPEEGGLSPQLLDRFGLYVDVLGTEDLNERVDIIKRRIKYEENPFLFINKWKEEDNKVWIKIEKARKLIVKIKVSEDMMKLASEISLKYNCSGHRAEIIMVEAAKAIAALNGRKNITIEDLKEASELVLPHRMRETPPNLSETEEEKEDGKNEKDEQNQGNNNGDLENDKTQEEIPNENPFEDNHDEEPQEDNEQGKDINAPSNLDEENIDKIGNIFKVKGLNIKPFDKKKRKGSGRRSIIKTSELQGQYTRYTFPKDKFRDIAFDATLRAAAPYQKFREKNGLALAIKESDIREKVREKRTGSTILFVVDASGSMGAKKRMEAVKGAIMSLLNDAYEKRDRVGMVAFRKEEAEIILNITRSVDLAHKKLKDLPTGGKTPLTLGLYRGYEILKAEKKKDSEIIPVMVLVSDGRGNISLTGKEPLDEAIEISYKISAEGIQSIVIDTEQDFIRLCQGEDIAKALGGSYYKLNDLKADEIFTAIRHNIQ